MKTNSMFFALGLSGVSLLTGDARGAFTGLSTEADFDDMSALSACRVYANFDHPLDRLVAVAGTPEVPLNIQVDNGTFHQSVFGTDLPPNLILIQFPTLVLDTFVTIGKLSWSGDQTTLSPGWPGFNPSSLSGTNLGWFVTPDQGQSLPIDGRVVLGQFSTFDGTRISGTMLLQTADHNGLPVFYPGMTFEHVIVPAPPGMLVLLLAARRRCRRRNDI